MNRKVSSEQTDVSICISCQRLKYGKTPIWPQFLGISNHQLTREILPLYLDFHDPC